MKTARDLKQISQICIIVVLFIWDLWHFNLILFVISCTIYYFHYLKPDAIILKEGNKKFRREDALK